MKNGKVVGMEVEKGEDGSNTSPLTGGSVAQVRVNVRLLKKTILD
jgi:hypothetical protein